MQHRAGWVLRVADEHAALAADSLALAAETTLPAALDELDAGRLPRTVRP